MLTVADVLARGYERAAELDAVCEEVTDTIGIPVCVVSILQGETQYFVASHGTTLLSSALADSACQRTVQRSLPTIIADALAHPRFCQSILVSEEPKIRFYAGARLALDGGMYPGAVAVLDFKPRTAFMLRDADPLVAAAQKVSAIIAN